MFTAGYMVQDPVHQQKILNGPIGTELFKTVVKKMDFALLAAAYLMIRRVNLRWLHNVKR